MEVRLRHLDEQRLGTCVRFAFDRRVVRMEGKLGVVADGCHAALDRREAS